MIGKIKHGTEGEGRPLSHHCKESESETDFNGILPLIIIERST